MREKERCFLVGVEAKSRRSTRGALKRKRKWEEMNGSSGTESGSSGEQEEEETFSVEESLTELSELVSSSSCRV